MRKADPVPISGLDALLANQVYFYDDPGRYTKSVNALCDELEKRVEKGEGVFPKGAPRVLLSGCPMAVPNWKVPWIIESSGATIVGEESCVGERGTRNLVDDSGNSVEELMEAIIDRYFQVDCAIFTPNPDGSTTRQRCSRATRRTASFTTASSSASPISWNPCLWRRPSRAKSIPTLRIETDYSMEDVGQLKTRVEAFIEQIK